MYTPKLTITFSNDLESMATTTTTGHQCPKNKRQQKGKFIIISERIVYPIFLGNNNIGRDKSSDIYINNQLISKKHAIIEVSGHKISIVIKSNKRNYISKYTDDVGEDQDLNENEKKKIFHRKRYVYQSERDKNKNWNI